mmetsp:Transcript_75014/g.160676  ORF Transcript_75014/g.160676 Transcript_75014/m.160676 type:complete len:255 (+) Transcript_75014:996-1760(+)
MHARQHEIANHPEAPDIRLLIIAAEEHLGGNIIRSACFCACRHPWLESPRNTEVDELQWSLADLLLRTKKPVLGLEVPVHDPVLMQIIDSEQHLAEASCCKSLVKVSRSDDAVEELASLAELQDQVDGPPILEALDEADDVRVVQQAHDLDLFVEPRRLLNRALLHALDGDPRTGALVFANPHRAEAALTYLGIELIDVLDLSSIGGREVPECETAVLDLEIRPVLAIVLPPLRLLQEGRRADFLRGLCFVAFA